MHRACDRAAESSRRERPAPRGGSAQRLDLTSLSPSYTCSTGRQPRPASVERQRVTLTRSLLLLIAMEQVAVDKGSWLLAYELTLEDEAPRSSLNADFLYVSLAPHSRLADERWVEMAHARLRTLDELAERRRRLEGRRAPDGWDLGAIDAGQAEAALRKACEG